MTTGSTATQGHRWVSSATARRLLAGQRQRLCDGLAGEVVVLCGPGADDVLADRADGSAPAVMSVLSLCSVRDLSATLAAVRRVLAPAGRFAFLEHVPDWPGSRRPHDVVGPLWASVGGCDATRDVPACVRASGFVVTDLERFRLPTAVFPLRRCVAGTAIPQEDL